MRRISEWISEGIQEESQVELPYESQKKLLDDSFNIFLEKPRGERLKES